MTIQPAAKLTELSIPVVGPPRNEASKPRQSPAPGPAAAEADKKSIATKSIEASRKELEEAARKVEKLVDPMGTQLQFSIDESSGESVIKVIDRSTSEVLRQIPSEEMLQIARAFNRLEGLLVNQKA